MKWSTEVENERPPSPRGAHFYMPFLLENSDQMGNIDYLLRFNRVSLGMKWFCRRAPLAWEYDVHVTIASSSDGGDGQLSAQNKQGSQMIPPPPPTLHGLLRLLELFWPMFILVSRHLAWSWLQCLQSNASQVLLGFLSPLCGAPHQLHLVQTDHALLHIFFISHQWKKICSQLPFNCNVNRSMLVKNRHGLHPKCTSLESSPIELSGVGIW